MPPATEAAERAELLGPRLRRDVGVGPDGRGGRPGRRGGLRPRPDLHHRVEQFLVRGVVRDRPVAVGEAEDPAHLLALAGSVAAAAGSPWGSAFPQARNAPAPDGHFDFTACLTHNYREFLGGFTDWVEQVADSKDALDYRRRVEDSETVSMWQSLSFGPNHGTNQTFEVMPGKLFTSEPALQLVNMLHVEA